MQNMGRLLPRNAPPVRRRPGHCWGGGKSEGCGRARQSFHQLVHKLVAKSFFNCLTKRTYVQDGENRMAVKRIEILPSWLSVSLLPSLRWTTLLCSRKTALRGARLNVQLFALEITRASSRRNRMSTEPFTVHCNVLVRQLKQKGDENFLQHRFRRALQVKKKRSNSIWFADGFAATQTTQGLSSTSGGDDGVATSSLL